MKGGELILDIANLTISSLTLVFTILGVVITLKQNIYSLDITHLNMRKDRGKEFVNFCFVNNSSKSIKLKSVSFFSGNSKLENIDFDPINHDEEEDKLMVEHWNKQHQSFNTVDPVSISNPYKMVNHSASEYEFYHQVRFPTVIHSDSDLEISTYLNQIPNKLVVALDKNVCIGFRFGIIPIFTNKISAVLHNNQR